MSISWVPSVIERLGIIISLELKSLAIVVVVIHTTTKLFTEFDFPTYNPADRLSAEVVVVRIPTVDYDYTVQSNGLYYRISHDFVIGLVYLVSLLATQGGDLCAGH